MILIVSSQDFYVIGRRSKRNSTSNFMHDDRFAEQFTYMRSIWQTNKYVFLKVAAFEHIYINYRALLAFFMSSFPAFLITPMRPKRDMIPLLVDGFRVTVLGESRYYLKMKISISCGRLSAPLFWVRSWESPICIDYFVTIYITTLLIPVTYLNSFDYSKPIQPSFLMDASPSRLLFECLSFLKLMSINDNPKVYVLIYLSWFITLMQHYLLIKVYGTHLKWFNKRLWRITRVDLETCSTSEKHMSFLAPVSISWGHFGDGNVTFFHSQVIKCFWASG